MNKFLRLEDAVLFLKRHYSNIKKRIPKRLPSIYIKQRKKKGHKKIIHISAYNVYNAGDTLLPVAVRDSIEAPSKLRFLWKSLHTSTQIKENTIKLINRSNGIIIGGGGLFLKDTNPNKKSGWQWSTPIQDLKKIEVPIVLFGVGYNRFRGQEDFLPIFSKHLNELVKKSPFIGLRNHGSIENIKRYIDEEYHDKIHFQPCPTTVISLLYPNLISEVKNKKPIVAVNCAFDRSALRYGSKMGLFLDCLASVAKKLSEDCDIHYYSHMESDNFFLPFLSNVGVPFKLVNLNVHPRTIIKNYQKPNLVIGMRGHAQMIPFGCLTPIISIISHNKMRWFLDDINHPEWGLEISDPNFKEKLLEKSRYALGHQSEIKMIIKEEQEKLYKVTMNNVRYIHEQLNLLD